MQRQPPATASLNWSTKMPYLSSNKSSSPNQPHQNSTDALNDADSLLLSALPETNFDTEEMENLFDEEMISHFEDCLRNGEGNLAPVLKANLGENSLDSLLPTTSMLNQPPNNFFANTSQNMPGQKSSRFELQSSRLTGRPSFDESDPKIANFIAKIPFRSSTTYPTRALDLDFSYNSELNVGLHLRKFEYFQLLNKHSKLVTKVKALANLLKFEVEEDHDHFLLRNSDTVIQICMDHKAVFTNCLISWYGANLRVNDKLKSLIQQDRWVSVLRHLKVMGSLIPSCVPMHDRVNCLNGLIILEHDLALLFKEDQLSASIYGKSNLEVYRPRTDLTPFTIAIHWETLKPNSAVNQTPQFDLIEPDALYVYLSVVHSEYITLFPTTTCLNKLQWSDMTTGVHTPGKYCLNFSRPMIVRNALLKELLELDSAVYTVRPVNWLAALSNTEIPGPSVVLTSKNLKDDCHCYVFPELASNKCEDYLVRRITFGSPKTIVALLTKIRTQANFIGLVKNLFVQSSRRKQLPYKEHLVITVESSDPTVLVMQFNYNQREAGTVTISARNIGFKVHIHAASGKQLNNVNLHEWNELLNRTWSIPILMHKIVVDLKLVNVSTQSLRTGQNAEINKIVRNGPTFRFFESVKVPPTVKREFVEQAVENGEENVTSGRVAENNTSQKLKKYGHFLRQCARKSLFLNGFFLNKKKIYQIRKSTAIKKIKLPVARLQAVMSVLSVDDLMYASPNIKSYINRVPNFIVKAESPLIVPSISQKLKLEHQKRVSKLALKRKQLSAASFQSNKSYKKLKKPNILKNSSTRKEGRRVLERTTRLNFVVRNTPAKVDQRANESEANARPKRSILKSKNLHRHMLNNNRPNAPRFGRMNQLTLAKKIVRRRHPGRLRFFGILNGWRRFYKRYFRVNLERRRQLKFEQKESPEMEALYSFQGESIPDPRVDSLTNVLSPDYLKRTTGQMSGFPLNSLVNPISLGLQNNYNIGGPYSAMHQQSGMFSQMNAAGNMTQKRAIDGCKGLPGDSFDLSRAPVDADGRQLMDLNASELAARRKERNVNYRIETELQVDCENAFEDSDEECDPPPPPKNNQQNSKDVLRRKRDQELRDQRQEKIHRMEMEKQKQFKMQEEEFVQRHQIPIRPARNLSNAGMSSNASFSQDQRIASKAEEKYGSSEYDANNEQKPSGQVESLSIKLPRNLAENIGRKKDKGDDKVERRGQKKRTESSSSSASGSTVSLSSSDRKSQQKRLKDMKKTRNVEIKTKKSAKTTDYGGQQTTSKGAPKIKEEDHKTEVHKDRVPSGKEALQMKRSSSASSSDSSSSSSTSSASSDSRPPTLTDRLHRQNSTMTEMLQQDDESRQSTRSNSSIPPLVLATNESTVSCQPSTKAGKNGRSSRKTSTIFPSTMFSYPFEIEAGTKNEYDEPESPPLAQLLASTSTSCAKKQFYNEGQKQKTNDGEKTRSKPSKDKSYQKEKQRNLDSQLEAEKSKEKKAKLSSEAAKTKSLDKSVDKIAERLKEREKTVQRLKPDDKPELQKIKNVQREAEKLKVKDKSALLKNKPSPRLQLLVDVFDVPSADSSKTLKRKRDAKDPTSLTKARPNPRELDKLASNLRNEYKALKEPRDAKEIVKELKSKRPKETKLLQEIPASPLPLMQTRKRSPLPRRKEELTKKTRVVDPEFKSLIMAEKSLRSKGMKPEDSRSNIKHTLSTSQSSVDEKRRKIRKIEKLDDKLKEPETPTRKKPLNIFPDLPEFIGLPSLNNLKNFKIPKVVDTDTAKNAEKEKETEMERDKEAEREKEQREKSRESNLLHKDQRAESSRDRWERDEKRDAYPDRRDTHVEMLYDRRSDNYFPNEPNQRDHYYSGRGGGNGYYGRGKSHGSYHSNYSGGAHRNADIGYDASPVYNERASSHFRRQRGGSMKPNVPVQPYDDRYNTSDYSLQQAPNKSRDPSHFLPPHHKKSLTDPNESPSYQPSSRLNMIRRSSNYQREKQNLWSAQNYQEEPTENRDFPSLMPPTNPLYSTFSAPSTGSFQPPSEEQFDTRDKDFRPPYYRNAEPDNSGGDSPSDGLQIDENA